VKEKQKGGDSEKKREPQGMVYSEVAIKEKKELNSRPG